MVFVNLVNLAKPSSFHFNLLLVSLCSLDLIHSDVWSCSTKSLGGYPYYVLFIDDFSRFTWLYHIHNKSDVFIVFVQFKSLVENQFSSSIKQFQCVGGGEYMSNQFKKKKIGHSWHTSPCLLPLHTTTKWCGRAQASSYHGNGVVLACSISSLNLILG
jgi:hypothetical protein